MREKIGTCALMQEDISVALLKAKEKNKSDESFIVDSVRWFPWQLTWEVIELEELSTPIQLHPQLIKRFSDNSADGTTVLNAMVGRSRGSRLGKQDTCLSIIKV